MTETHPITRILKERLPVGNEWQSRHLAVLVAGGTGHQCQCGRRITHAMHFSTREWEAFSHEERLRYR